MGLAVIAILGLLGEGLLLYLLVHWMREGRPRKTKPEVHRKKAFLGNSRTASDKKRFRDFEETIHRRIARHTAIRKHEVDGK